MWLHHDHLWLWSREVRLWIYTLGYLIPNNLNKGVARKREFCPFWEHGWGKLFCISATEDPLNPSGTKPGWMLHQINAIINMVTHRGKCREPAIALVTPECRWPECQEGIPLWNEAFLSLIQALPILMCQGRDTEQGHGCCAQWIRAKWISTRPKARAKPFAPSAPLKCQEFLMALVMGCTGQLPNHHRTLPRQSRVKIIGQQQGIMDTRQKKGFQTSTSKILRKTPKHVCCYTQEWLLGESKPTNCLWITEPWRKALCTRNSGRQAAKWSRKQQWKQGPSSDTGGNSCLHLCINISRTDSKLSQGFSYIPFHVSPSQRCWSVLSCVAATRREEQTHSRGRKQPNCLLTTLFLLLLGLPHKCRFRVLWPGMCL